MRQTLGEYLESGGADWAVWIGAEFVVAEYDSSHTIFRRADGHAWRSLTRERVREILEPLVFLHAMGEAYHTGY